MFEVVQWDGRTEVVVDVFCERGNAEAFAREKEAKAKGPVAYFARRARG
jgi:hypothetical protein